MFICKKKKLFAIFTWYQSSLTDCLLVTKQQMYLYIPSRDQAVSDPAGILGGMVPHRPPDVLTMEQTASIVK